jgi:hypothetical protein
VLAMSRRFRRAEKVMGVCVLERKLTGDAMMGMLVAKSSRGRSTFFLPD